MDFGTIERFGDYGLAGLVILALFCVVIFLVREHRAERQEWLAAYRSQTTMMDNRQGETNDVIRTLSVVIGELNERHRNFKD